MLYLGYYAYISGLCKEKERASKLARRDGVEQIAVMIGKLLLKLKASRRKYLCNYLIKRLHESFQIFLAN